MAMLPTYAILALQFAPIPGKEQVEIPQIDNSMPSSNAATESVSTQQIDMSVPPLRLALDQLPDTLEPSDNSDEASLDVESRPQANLAREVVTAWHAIRQRGRTPTPDLIASEIGADKVAEFLASGGEAASILATGTLPNSTPEPTPDSGRDGVVILPPGKG
jgi:hypothetical protein